MSKWSFNTTKKKKKESERISSPKQVPLGFKRQAFFCEVARALIDANFTRLGDAQSNKAAFHGYWGFSGQILKCARQILGRGHREGVEEGPGGDTSEQGWDAALGPFGFFLSLSHIRSAVPQREWTRIKYNLSSTATSAATRQRVAIFTFQTGKFTTSSFLKWAYHNSKFSLCVLEETYGQVIGSGNCEHFCLFWYFGEIVCTWKQLMFNCIGW